MQVYLKKKLCKVILKIYARLFKEKIMQDYLNKKKLLCKFN